MNDDDPLASLLRPLFQEPAEREEPVTGPLHDDLGPFPPSAMDEPTSAPIDTGPWPMLDPHPEDIDRKADLRSRLEFIRKELPPAQRREWMLRLLNQFSDLSEDTALFGELNNYMRLTQEEEHAAGEFWERTPQAWDHPRGGDYENDGDRDSYRLV